jgi:hypothetical protein
MGRFLNRKRRKKEKFPRLLTAVTRQSRNIYKATYIMCWEGNKIRSSCRRLVWIGHLKNQPVFNVSCKRKNRLPIWYSTPKGEKKDVGTGDCCCRREAFVKIGFSLEVCVKDNLQIIGHHFFLWFEPPAPSSIRDYAKTCFHTGHGRWFLITQRDRIVIRGLNSSGTLYAHSSTI